MGTKRHVHRYQRDVLGKSYVIYKCALPDCTHYVPENLVVGRESQCNRCKKNNFIIKRTQDGRILHKPHCEECTMPSKNPKARKRSLPKAEIAPNTRWFFS
jgi:hypothetical protein